MKKKWKAKKQKEPGTIFFSLSQTYNTETTRETSKLPGAIIVPTSTGYDIE